MFPGFKTRLLQEIRHILDTQSEFEPIRETAPYFGIAESCFPPNCLVWAGASVLSSLNSEIEKFEIT
jgi:actin-related protein